MSSTPNLPQDGGQADRDDLILETRGRLKILAVYRATFSIPTSSMILM
ncbi:MAG: hypothetical protein MUO67_13135 [Anaerolineales bacterium]|nr:hypothetical protein [Anaerolineales bacterium]